MTTSSPQSDPKIAQLEQQLNRLEQQVVELNKRLMFLERENNRRKNEINQVARG
jgi:chromosome segregation ATPase